MHRDDSWHGTSNGYYNHKCRCDDCRRAGREYGAQYRARRREAIAKHQANYRARNRPKVNGWAARYRSSGQHRDNKYGLSAGQFDAMLAAQGGRCAICGREFGEKTPHIDHDHACCSSKSSCGRCVRGLLCQACNQGLGNFKDDPLRMAEAIAYISRTTSIK
jgi:hypothetical protein